MPLSPLPIDAVLPELTAALRQSPAVVLSAPTGAGKTTRVPPALLDAGWAERGQIIILEPRRLAARAAARRMAQERGARLGDLIGYHVRFERLASRATRILAVTPGILLRRLHDDPFLENVSAVIFDEFHERSLDNDFALGLVHLLQQTVRPELRLVVMSATLAVEKVAAYLGDVPIITSAGRLHPIAVDYRPPGVQTPLAETVVAGVRELLDRTPGDLVVFLPGLQEIRQCSRELEPLAKQHGLAVLPLHGDLPPEQQDAALLKQNVRKIVLATNVAETSVTVEGVTGVLDSGLARQMTFDPAVGLDRLQLVPIARDSAEQRAGRAGRLEPGVCIRLWSAANHRTRAEQTLPEIARVDLCGAVLHLLALGEKDVLHFPWFEPPTWQAVEPALVLLRRLGAVEGDTITELGQSLARLPVHPRLGRLLIEGSRLGAPERVALAAALLSERDPFTRNVDAPRPSGPGHASTSDVVERVEILEEFERSGRTETPLGSLHRGGTRFLLHARDQLLRLLQAEVPGSASPEPHEAIERALVAAFPDRLARRREPGSRKGVMVGGRGVRLAPSSVVSAGELFLCIDVDGAQAEALVRQASLVRREWLPPEGISSTIEVEFDPSTEKVQARKRTRYDDLVLEETLAALPGAAEVARVLSEAACQNLERVLPPPDSAGGQYLTRLRCLRQWWPELNLPDFNDPEFRELLTWLCPRCRSFEELRQADWLGALQGRLSYEQQQLVEREAPERLEVPTGSRITLQYAVGRPPVLAVRIQELFGLEETPRLAGGRVKVLLHLLAPNYRPQQVTDDLTSFWHNTYPVVRKELRARYPKHAWPEEPWNAPPQRGPRRR